MSALKTIDVVVPCFNEERSLPAFCERLRGAFEKLPDYSLRAIFVDDGSTDRTLDKLTELASEFERVKMISLSRNFGKEAAIMAGLSKADADAVIVIDADLQHPPELISDLVAEWESGFDNVVARRSSRGSDGFLRRLGSKLFYWALNRMSSHEIVDGEGDYRLISKRVVKSLRELRESELFLKGLYGFVGYSKTTVPYEVEAGTGRSSRYSFRQLAGLAMTGLLSNTTVPLRVSFWLGFVIALTSLMYLVTEVIRYFVVGTNAPGFTSLIAITTLIGGANLLFVGIVGEYVGRMFMENKRRPQFIIGDETDHVREL